MLNFRELKTINQRSAARVSWIGAYGVALLLSLFLTLPAASAPGDTKTKTSYSGSKILLELYTSQGCSSCPSADALLPGFIAQDDIIALSMSVDYWDYLGWRDTFGQAMFTKRQHSYAKQFGVGHVYTPQIVVDGRSHHNGADKNSIEKMIERRRVARAQNPPVELDVKTQDGTLVITVGGSQKARPQKKATLWMALISKKESVKVRRGENRGEILTYHNVVRKLTPIGHWSGEKMTVKLPKKHLMPGNTDGCVILLQDGDGGPIVAAVEMQDW